MNVGVIVNTLPAAAVVARTSSGGDASVRSGLKWQADVVSHHASEIWSFRWSLDPGLKNVMFGALLLALLIMNARILSTEPETNWNKLVAANRRHDSEKHSITMWQRAKYKGDFGYPPLGPKPKRPRAVRCIDQWGNVTVEVRGNSTEI